jgi:plastocyanin
MQRFLLCLTIAAAPVFAACSTSDSGAATCETPTQTTTVDIQDMAFSASCVAATANDTLSVVNHDQVVHTYTVTGTSINVNVDAGQTAQADLTGIAPGTYSVTCQYHPTMKASLRVT